LDRTARKFIEGHSQVITKIRNGVEHMGQKIATGEIKERDLLVPYLSEDEKSVEFGDHAIRIFSDLAAFLKQLFRGAPTVLGRQTQLKRKKHIKVHFIKQDRVWRLKYKRQKGVVTHIDTLWRTS
jgi:hypothetical protein